MQRGEGYIPDSLHKTLPLNDTRYLNSRGLTSETLASPLFASRILNYLHEGISKSGQPYKFVNTAFPQLYKGNIVGLEIKATSFKESAVDSLHRAS